MPNHLFHLKHLFQVIKKQKVKMKRKKEKKPQQNNRVGLDGGEHQQEVEKCKKTGTKKNPLLHKQTKTKEK